MSGDWDTSAWFMATIRTFIEQPTPRKDELQDAQDFVLEALLYDGEAADDSKKRASSSRLLHLLLRQCIGILSVHSDKKDNSGPRSQDLALREMQQMIRAFGRKQPKVSPAIFT